MSPPIREPEWVLVALRAALDAHPDQRVMQVIVNALGTDPFFIEDLSAADKLYAYAGWHESPRGAEQGSPHDEGEEA